MLLKCCLLQYRHDLTETCYIFYICLYVWFLNYLSLIYVICFFIIIFIFITFNYIISLRQKDLFFGHVCQKFSLSVLLSFCLIFCQFQPGGGYKSVAYKKKRVSSNCNRKKYTLRLRFNFQNCQKYVPNFQKPPLPSKIPGYVPENLVLTEAMSLTSDGDMYISKK